MSVVVSAIAPDERPCLVFENKVVIPGYVGEKEGRTVVFAAETIWEDELAERGWEAWFREERGHVGSKGE